MLSRSLWKATCSPNCFVTFRYFVASGIHASLIPCCQHNSRRQLLPSFSLGVQQQTMAPGPRVLLLLERWPPVLQAFALALRLASCRRMRGFVASSASPLGRADELAASFRFLTTFTCHKQYVLNRVRNRRHLIAYDSRDLAVISQGFIS